MSSINTSLNNNIHNIDIVNRSNQRIIDEIIKIYANLIDSDVQKINFTRCTHSVDKNLIHVYVDCTNRQRLNELVMFLNEKSLVFVDEIIKTLAFPKKLWIVFYRDYLIDEEIDRENFLRSLYKITTYNKNRKWIILGLIIALISLLFTVFFFVRYMTGQKKIGIFGNNNVEVYQGIEGTQMYDAKYNGEFLLDCQWDVTYVSGIIPDRLAITNDGNLNYKFTRMGVSSITIHANKNGFNKSSFIVNFTILPQTILIMPQDGVADIDIAINNVGSKQYFAKYYEQGLSGCIWKLSQDIIGVSINESTGVVSWTLEFSQVIQSHNLQIICEKLDYPTGYLPIALTVTNQTRISGDDTINAGEKLVGTHAYNALCGSTALSDGNWSVIQSDGLVDLSFSNNSLSWTIDTTQNIGTYQIVIGYSLASYLDTTFSITFIVYSRQIIISPVDGVTNIEIFQNTSGFKNYSASCTSEVFVDATWSILNSGGLTSLTINNGKLSWTTSTSAFIGYYDIVIKCEKTGYILSTLSISIVISVDTSVIITGLSQITSLQYYLPTSSSTYVAKNSNGDVLNTGTWQVACYENDFDSNGILPELSMNPNSGKLTWTINAIMRPDTYNILIQYIVGNEITTYPVDFIVLFESSSYIIDDEDIKYSFEYSEGNLESLTQIPEATGIMKWVKYADNGLSYGMMINLGHIKGIHFGASWDILTTAPSKFMNSLFARNTYTQLWCLDLPRNLTNVDSYFLNYLFLNSTNLTTIPNSFYLPSSLNYNNKDFFLARIFYGCEKLIKLPYWFNIPTNSGGTELGADFLTASFMNTIALEYLPNRFNIPQNITSVSSGFLDATFRSSRIRLYPTDFNIPLMITSIGPRFLMGTFRNNINLTKLPYNFSIPAVVGRAETYFDLCEWMFYSCGNLEKGGEYVRNLVFPSGDGFNAGGAPPYYNNGWQTFYGCTKIFLDSVPEGIVDSISGNIEPGASIPIARTAP